MYGIFHIRSVSVGLDSQIWYLFIYITGYLNVRKMSETMDFRTFVGSLRKRLIRVETVTLPHNNSSKWGFHWKGEYFDCEADAARRNTVQKLIGAFSPRNKNPQDAFTSIGMGIRQVLSFMMLYPRAEKCGMYFSWSQSSQNPVKTLQVWSQSQFYYVCLL